MNNPKNPSRLLLASLALATIALGLASRRFPLFPAALQNYPGDALWATLVFILWTLLFPQKSLLALAALTLATSFAVELSQLYHAPWLDSLRATLPGRLILGSGFDPIDLIAYTLGTVTALALVHFTRGKSKS